MSEQVSEIAFGRGGNAEGHLGSGWSAGEDGFRWMIGEASELWLDNPGRGTSVLELRLAPFVHPPKLPAQRLRLRVRGMQMGEITLARGATLGFHLPDALLAAPGPLRIELLHPDAAAPSNVSDSTDGRLLSLRLETARIWRLPPFPDAAAAIDWEATAPNEVLAEFHSLGQTAAFGAVQVQSGHQPDDLFAFSHIELASLLHGLDSRLAGLGDATRLQRADTAADHTFLLRDTVLAANFDTRLPRQDDTPAELLTSQAARLAAAAQQLLEHIAAVGTHFILTRPQPLPECEVLPLFCRLGGNDLLWVVPADAAHPAGTIETVLPGLHRGYLTAPTAAGDAASLPEWLRLCRAVLSGTTTAVPPSTPPAPALIGIAPPAARTTVFLGNCQVETLAALYRGLLPAGSNEQVVYVASYREADAGQKRAVAEADMVLRQVLDFSPRIGDLPTRGTVILVPHVTGAFLWPYCGDAHPRNAPEPHLDVSGPYPPELGDQFLNRMLAQEVAADKAVQRYRDTDIARTRRVDRLLELFLDRLRQRDSLSGFAFADYIAERFRRESLFRTPNHMETGMALHFAATVFARMGVPDAAIARLRDTPPDTIFPPSEAPIHPSIAAHFAMAYAPPGRFYRYFNEGRFSFEEFAGRYMRYEWNAALAEGMYLLRQRQLEAGVAKLLDALPMAPRSARGRLAVANALAQLGRLAEAADFAAQAAALEPDEARFVRRAAELAKQAGR